MADIRISELSDLQNVEDNDVLVINDTSAATTKRITRERFLLGITRNVTDSGDNVIIKEDATVNNDLIVGGDIDATGDVSFGSLTDVTAGITANRFIGTGIQNHDSNGAIPTAAAVIDYLDYFLSDLYDSATLPVTLDALTNVSIVTPLAGEVLKWSGSAWVNGTDSAGIDNLGALTDVLIGGLTDGQVLKYNGAYWVNATDSSGPTTLVELSDVVITSPTVNQVLKYNGTKWVNAADSSGGGGGGGGGLDSALATQLINTEITLNSLSGVSISSPTTNQVIKYNGSQWVNAADSGGTGSGLSSRANLTVQTASIADQDSADVVISGYKAYSLFKIQTDRAAWVRVYTDSASRTADLGRLQAEDPLPGAGVVAEVITSGAETINLAPAPTGFNNSSPVTNSMPLKIVNLSGVTNPVEVTLTALKLEI